MEADVNTNNTAADPKKNGKVNCQIMTRNDENKSKETLRTNEVDEDDVEKELRAPVNEAHSLKSIFTSLVKRRILE